MAEITQIQNMIESMGYNPFGITSTGTEDAQKLAEENGISVEEAQAILKEASEQSSAMLDMLSAADEEEIVDFDDADFDDFLKNASAEEEMQNIFAKQQNLKPEENKQQNMFSNSNNPFFKPAWQL